MPAVAQQQPADERDGRQRVDGGRIEARQPVGDADVARLALLGRRHEPHQLAEEGVVAGGGDFHRDGGCDVHLARVDEGAGLHRLGRRLAGEQRAVHVGGAFADQSVGRQAVARSNGHDHAGLEVARGHIAAAAVGLDQRGALGGERDQLRDGRAGAGAHQVVEVAPGEQEEQQRDGGVEIGMRLAVDGLEQAHEGGEQHAERDRHIHVDAAEPERIDRRIEEGPTGIGDGGKRDHRRQPVEQVARGAFGP